MSKVGFIGTGKLGLPFAQHLTDAATVVTTQRGNPESIVAKGGEVPGDGSAKAVAEAADGIIFTCLRNEAEVVETIDQLLEAEGDAPVVVEMSTVPIPAMERERERLAERGGDLLDCPVSGTPEMVMAKKAVIFVSGDKEAADKVGDLISAIAPVNVFVGPLGAGTNFKYVANLLAFSHVTVAAEAMAFAEAAGLNLELVSKVMSGAPGATSGQFQIRSPMMAAKNFDNPMVTVDQMREVCNQIRAHAAELGAATPMVDTVYKLYEEFGATGEGASDPGKLMLFLADKAKAQA